MNDNEMDELFHQLPSPDPALLEAIRKPLLADVTPVRPLPGAPTLAAAFCLLFSIVAAIGSYFLGFGGFRLLSLSKRAAIGACLLTLAIASASAVAGRMRPGTRRLVPGWVLPVMAVTVFEGLFLVLLQDYGLENFLHSGLVCLGIGLLFALPVALLAPLLLRRGYVVAPLSTGAALGVGAGLVGLAVIEFHCPIQTFPHVGVWHVAIVAVSAVLGAVSGALSRRLS